MASVLLFVHSADAATGKWTAARGEEDWGAFCTLSFKQGGGVEFGFHGSPGSYAAAYVKSEHTKFPEAITLGLQADDGELHSLPGEMNDYFGKPEFILKSSNLLKDLAKGKMLSVSVSAMRPMSIPLAGFEKALRDFSKCLAT